MTGGRVGLLGATLWLALAAAGSAHAEAAPDWRDCGEGLECARLAVPRDRAARGGPSLDLALIRHRARDPGRRIGVLVVNPGGPGASGVEYLRGALPRFGPALLERFDLLAFDPRGAGESAPLDCRGDLGPWLATDPEPDDADEWRALLAASRELAARCGARHAALLPHLGTADVAADLESIRRALGERRISYLGLSYGSLLGAVYATHHPERVRAAVLDGAIDPALTLYEFSRAQAVHGERAFDAALAECVPDTCELARHGEPRVLLAELEARVEAAPLASRDPALRAAGPRELAIALATGLYSPASAAEALDAVAAAIAERDGGPLVRLADAYLDRRPDGSYPNSFEALLAVTCLDLPAPRDAPAWRARAAELARAAPRFGVTIWTLTLPCAFWPVPPRPLAPLESGGAAPVLVVLTDADPLTPRAWGEAVAARLAGSVQLRVDGRAHLAYGRGNPCVVDAVERFLLELERPAPGARCPR